LKTLIYLIDDDPLLRRSLCFNLEQAGYAAKGFDRAEDAFSAMKRNHPDLILLDIGLPGMDGLEALKEFRRAGGTPVIFLTARRRELDEVLGLELGAEDYITKPFDKDVLLARVRARLRRPAAAADLPAAGIARAGDIEVDPGAHTARRGTVFLDLSPREFDLLHALALEPDCMITTEDLIQRVWGAGFQGQPQVLYVHIRWLREKIEEDPDHPRRILTIRGRGYKLVSAPSPD
jgi:DNA-binding response OmpR family regulator